MRRLGALRQQGLLARGTLRNPGPDLSRLPIGLDLRALSIADGIRAAFACAAVILVHGWVPWPPLLYMALAANLTCFADVGGPLRGRLAALATFSIMGGVIWGSFAMLRPLGLPLVVPLACIVIFCTSFARVWGAAAMGVGNVLTVVMVFALDQPLDLEQALIVAGMFAAGGAWSTLLTLIVWRIDSFQPARSAVVEVWRLMALMVADVRDLARRHDASSADWEAHARAHRRAVREAIEQARTIVGDLIRMRGSASVRGTQALLRLEAAEQIYGAIIALSDLLEEVATPGRRAASAKLLRVLQPLLLRISRMIRTDAKDEPPHRQRAMTVALASMLSETRDDATLHRIAETIVERLRIVLGLSAPGTLFGGGSPGTEAAGSWSERMMGPIRANLTWDSAMLRHAVRAAAIAAPALVITLIWQGAFTHWLTITVVLTMQPFYAATWQRALERIGGTVLGGLIGALLAHAVNGPLVLAGLMFPLCVIGFSARQVSYGAFIACLMPQLVVLVELIQPGHSSWEIFAMRALFTVLGGAIAVIGCLVLWPSWEPPRLRRQLAAALLAQSRYAGAVLSVKLGESGEPAVQQTRRHAGVAINNLEDSLARAIQEPRRRRRRQAELDAAMVADASLRRLGGRLTVLHHDSTCRHAIDAEQWRRWRDWIISALAALAKGDPLPERPPGEAGIDALARIARQIDLLESTLREFRAGRAGGTLAPAAASSPA